MSNISIFDSFPKKRGQAHIASGVLGIDEFLEYIRSGYWKSHITAIRKEEDKEKRKRLKESLPAVTISGTFGERRENQLISHSGFICIDIDHFNLKDDFIKDPYTYALMLSVSGEGLAVVVRIDPKKHKDSFRWLAGYYYNKYDIVVDPTPSSVASLRFVTYDPGIYINQQSKTALFFKKPEPKPKSIPVVLDNDKISGLVKECVERKITLVSNYDQWFRMAYAFADGLGEDGRPLFHALCSVHEKYDPDNTDRRYDYALKGNKRGITIGTFFWAAGQAGIEIPRGDTRATSRAVMAKKAGKPIQEAAKIVARENGALSPSIVKNLVEEVYKREDLTIQHLSKSRSDLINNLLGWLKSNYSIQKNVLTQNVEIDGVPVINEKINTIYLKASTFFDSKDITKNMVESCIFSEMVPSYNPITEYIEKNKHRKQTGMLDGLCQTIRTNTEMHELFIRRWYLSIIAAYNGYPVRYVLALVGGQNTGKTEWFRRLLPKDLMPYYAESKLDLGKDDELLMCQKLIIMDDEMGGKSKQDAKRFKELTSRDTFSIRPPYGRMNQDFKRLAVLGGTSNDINVVNDPTGNTRILPIEALSFDHELYNTIDKDELFMEAYRLYESGEPWQLTRGELIKLGIISDSFEGIKFEQELICNFFRRPQEGEFPEYCTATKIKTTIESSSGQKLQAINKFGIELRKILGDPIKKKIDGMAIRVYPCIRLKGDSGGAAGNQLDFNNNIDPF